VGKLDRLLWPVAVHTFDFLDSCPAGCLVPFFFFSFLEVLFFPPEVILSSVSSFIGNFPAPGRGPFAGTTHFFQVLDWFVGPIWFNLWSRVHDGFPLPYQLCFPSMSFSPDFYFAAVFSFLGRYFPFVNFPPLSERFPLQLYFPLPQEVSFGRFFLPGRHGLLSYPWSFSFVGFFFHYRFPEPFSGPGLFAPDLFAFFFFRGLASWLWLFHWPCGFPVVFRSVS